MSDAMTKRVEKLEQRIDMGITPKIVVLEKHGDPVPPGTHERDFVVITGVCDSDAGLQLSPAYADKYNMPNRYK